MKLSKKTRPDVPGSRILEARLARGLSQEKLGVLIGLEEGSASARISRYESGIHKPQIGTAKNIAKALKVPMGYLYTEQDEMALVILRLSKLSPKELADFSKKIPL